MTFKVPFSNMGYNRESRLGKVAACSEKPCNLSSQFDIKYLLTELATE